MSKLFYKAMIEDVQREKCSHKEVEHLLDVFTYAVKRTAPLWRGRHGFSWAILPTLKIMESTALL